MSTLKSLSPSWGPWKTQLLRFSFLPITCQYCIHSFAHGGANLHIYHISGLPICEIKIDQP